MKKILILGGTLFLGRVLVESLIGDPRYSIILFNRNITNSNLFQGIDRIIGDRYIVNDFKKLSQHKYDCVIDTTGYFPDFLENELQILKDRVDRYIFISTISAYEFSAHDNIFREDSPTLPCSEKQKLDKATMAFGNLSKPVPHLYGAKKAECERILLNTPWIDPIILRPALIYGKYDFCDRFYYWLYRAKTQDKILVPSKGKEVQNNTYVSDLVNIIKQAIEIKTHSKVYNVTTHEPCTILENLEIMRKHFNTNPTYVTVPNFFLKLNRIRPYHDIPSLWDGNNIITDSSKLKKEFICNFTSYEDSIAQTIYYNSQFDWKEGKDGMSVNKEQEIINYYIKNKNLLA